MKEQLEALKTADIYIENIKLEIGNLVQQINSGEQNNGIKLVYLLADGIEQLVDLINLTKGLHKDGISIRNTNDILEEMIEALENEDYVLISDLSQYEFLPIFEGIQNDIRHIIANYGE